MNFCMSGVIAVIFPYCFQLLNLNKTTLCSNILHQKYTLYCENKVFYHLLNSKSEDVIDFLTATLNNQNSLLNKQLLKLLGSLLCFF